MAYRQEFPRRGASLNNDRKVPVKERQELTIAGFPPTFVLVMTIIFIGVLLLVVKAIGLV